MSNPSTREELKDWCLRQLGFPVIDINVDPDQVDDRIDEAFQYFQQFHFDGVERTYTKHQLTNEDIENKYLPVSDNIIGVTRIFPVSATNATVNMFDLRYQLRLHELYDFTSTSYVNYVLTMQHIRTLDMLFSGEQPIRFNRHTNRLYLDWNWVQYSQPGEWIIIEGSVITDPEQYGKVYNDMMLKRLATAYIKRQWGANMSKFAGMQLPGGITLNGPQLYQQAIEEIKELEEQIRMTYESPPVFIMG
jgi:predicted transcriptional regulator